MRVYVLFSLYFLLALFACAKAAQYPKQKPLQQQYLPTWESLDSRPLPAWYDEAKFGIFIHWSVFSVPSYGCVSNGAAGEWYWWNLDGAKQPCLVEWHKKTYGDNFQYQDFAHMFQTSIFNPDRWAQIFKNSGAKYVVLTSKHHDGYCNWPSAQSWNWNSVDTGPHQDNVGLVSAAVRKAGLKMGLYHSLFEWFNPLYLADKAAKGNTTVYVDTILHPQLHEIVNNYKPEIVWSDGDWEQPDTYWKSKEFLAWLYNDSPVRDTVVVNDRWGAGDGCKHGGYFTCDDRYNPGKLINHKWENCLTVDKTSWGYNRNSNLSDYMTIDELLFQLASTVSCGGNMLLNVGPASDGTITPIFEDRLTQLGQWLQVNGEAIYSSKPWRAQNDTADQTVWYTSKGAVVYAILLEWPGSNKLTLTQPTPGSNTKIEMLGYEGEITWSAGQSITVQLPPLAVSQLPSTHAWVLKLHNVK